jgi:membrane protein
MMRCVRVFLKSFIDFFRDGGLVLAGSLSFFTMMAIVPFCLFLVTILGQFLGQDKDFYQFFVSRITSFFPTITSHITEEMKRIITYHGLRKYSLLLYGFLSYQLFSSIESALNVIFKIRVSRSLIVSFILSLFVVTMVVAVLLISFGATSVISLLQILKEAFPGHHIGRITGFLIGSVIPLFLVFLIVMILYLVLPRRMVTFANALWGALFTSVFLEVAKHLFTIYVVHVTKLGSIYGPLSAFVIFLLWVFYSWCIFLIGAEVVHNLGFSQGR